MFSDLSDLIAQGRVAHSKEQIFDWVYEAEVFLKDRDLIDDEIDLYIRSVKQSADVFDDLKKLLACLKSKNVGLVIPAITGRNQIFVAMWFSDEMHEYYENGYVPAIQYCNYSCRRIDEKQFNGSIIEEIVKEIGNSIFLIADLTNNRGGVYYEAGIAKGLSLCNHPIKLILTCKSDYFHSDKKPHFDVSGDNIIVYDTAGDLKEKLSKRIKGTEQSA